MERLHAYVDVCITMYHHATNVKLAYLIAFSIYIFFLKPKMHHTLQPLSQVIIFFFFDVLKFHTSKNFKEE